MKVNPKITKQVNDSVAECHEMIKNAIVILLKQIGAGNGDVVVFNRILFLFQSLRQFLYNCIPSLLYTECY